MEEIITRILDGDRHAYLEIVDAYSPNLRAYFASRITDPATIDDLTQETFIAAYQALDRFDPSRNFSAWIKGIAHKRLMMNLRSIYAKEKAYGSIRVDVFEDLSPDLDRMQKEDQHLRLNSLRSCMEKLPERSKAIVQSRYFDNESVGALAARLETTVSGISSTLYRIKQRLKSCMSQEIQA